MGAGLSWLKNNNNKERGVWLFNKEIFESQPIFVVFMPEIPHQPKMEVEGQCAFGGSEQRH